MPAVHRLAVLPLLALAAAAQDLLGAFFLFSEYVPLRQGFSPTFELFSLQDPTKLGDFAQAGFRGNWTAAAPPLDFFPTSTGGFFLYFYEEPTDDSSFEIHLRLHQGHLVEQRTIELALNFTIESPGQSKIIGKTVAKVEKSDHIFDDLGSFRCAADVELFLLDEHGKPVNITSDLVPGMNLRGSIRSDNCTGLSFTFAADIDNGYLSVAVVSAFCWVLLIILTLGPLIEGLGRRVQRLLNISPDVLLLNLAGDFLFMLLNAIFTLVAHAEFFEFAVVVSMFLICSIMIKLRIYFLVFQTSREAAGVGAVQLQKEVVRESARVLAVVVGVLFASTFLFTHYYFFALLFVYPFLQVAHNASYVLKKNCFDAALWLPLLGSQLWFLVFTRGISSDFSRLRTDLPFIALLAGLLALALLLMALQKALGPKFFIPKRWRTGYHSYRQRIPPELQGEHHNCPICFYALSQAPSEHEQPLHAPILLTTYMRTPCNHGFHEECLVQWMNTRLNCPCCRKAIPPHD